MALTSELGVTLLHIAQPLDEHLHWDIFIVLVEVFLGRVSGKVDEGISIRGDPSETGENVAAASQCGPTPQAGIRSLVQEEDLLSTASEPCLCTLPAHSFSTSSQ